MRNKLLKQFEKLLVLVKSFVEWVYLLSSLVLKEVEGPNDLILAIEQVNEPAFAIYVFVYILTKIGVWPDEKNGR